MPMTVETAPAANGKTNSRWIENFRSCRIKKTRHRFHIYQMNLLLSTSFSCSEVLRQGVHNCFRFSQFHFVHFRRAEDKQKDKLMMNGCFSTFSNFIGLGNLNRVHDFRQNLNSSSIVNVISVCILLFFGRS